MSKVEGQSSSIIRHRTISYNQIAPAPNKKNGRKSAGKISATSDQAWAIIAPYVSIRVIDQLKAVIPLAAYLMLFQLLILQHPIDAALSLCLGLIAVVIGLTVFMEGLNTGLMPFGTLIGDKLPKRASMPMVLTIIGLLGIGVTFAEPAIGALQAFGASVDPQQAPYLYEILNNWTMPLVIIVGIGVGIAAILGTIRFVKGWSLKPMIFAAIIPVLCLTAYAWSDPDLRVILGLAWDCGAVTTGPVTVPLVLSLGIGIAKAAGKGNSSLSGFGVVTLASLFPILAVLVLAIYVGQIITPEEIIAAAQHAQTITQKTTAPMWERTPFIEIILGVRAILPLVLFLMAVLFIILKSPIKNKMLTYYGLSLSVFGMCIFNLGLTYGLGAIGTQTGSVLPAAFMEISASHVSPIFPGQIGITIVILFALILGFGATLAEPALNALGITVESLTNGAFKKTMLMFSVAGGVAVGISLGIAKLILGFDLMLVLIPLYILGLVLTLLSTEEFVNVAWDSAGVTTGPVTVPLVLAMGLGLGNAVSAIEGFGILSLASICPIVAVLSMGLFIKLRQSNERIGVKP